MNDNTLNKIGLAGMAGIGGVTGYLWATMLTVTEIAAVSNPVGIVCGALAFVGLGLHAMELQDD